MLTPALRQTGTCSQTRLPMVLLFILLSHLALMASPLHSMTMHLIPAVVLPAHVTVHEGHGAANEPPALPVPDRQQSIDCVLECAPPSGQSILRVPASEALPTWARLSLDRAVPSFPLPRALAPPWDADPQAFLQVFRI
jgi:hypothetical protein